MEVSMIPSFYWCVRRSGGFTQTWRCVIAIAGFDESKVKVITGSANASIPEVKRMLKGQAADQVFMDHCKPCLKPDLVSLEEAGMVKKGTVVVAIM